MQSLLVMLGSGVERLGSFFAAGVPIYVQDSLYRELGGLGMEELRDVLMTAAQVQKNCLHVVQGSVEPQALDARVLELSQRTIRENKR